MNRMLGMKHLFKILALLTQVSKIINDQFFNKKYLKCYKILNLDKIISNNLYKMIIISNNKIKKACKDHIL